jgi:ABC-type glycerol-3-phosphate transport system permease component
VKALFHIFKWILIFLILFCLIPIIYLFITSIKPYYYLKENYPQLIYDEDNDNCTFIGIVINIFFTIIGFPIFFVLEFKFVLRQIIEFYKGLFNTFS